MTDRESASWVASSSASGPRPSIYTCQENVGSVWPVIALAFHQPLVSDTL